MRSCKRDVNTDTKISLRRFYLRENNWFVSRNANNTFGLRNIITIHTHKVQCYIIIMWKAYGLILNEWTKVVRVNRVGYLHACILVGRRRRIKIIIKKFVKNDNIDIKISASRYSHVIFQQPRVRITIFLILYGSLLPFW